jgi:hypothetical protein
MGSGHALDAIKRIEYNRSLLKMHRARFSELKKAVSKIEAKYHVFKDRNTLTERELTQYKRKVKNKIIRERQKVFLRSLTITILISISIIYITKFLYNLFLDSF